MTVPTTMAAAFIRATGGVDRIEVGRLPVPRLGPTDVLVRFEASEVNHVDVFVRSGAYQTPLPFPFVIGRDVVGTVASVGGAVDRFVPGEHVWTNSLGHAGRQGTFSEYVVIDVDRAYRLPDGVEPVDAAVVLHGAGTAHVGLVREARLLPGETVFVGGAAGAVGMAVMQFATAMGAQVVASASPRDADLCRAGGAGTVVDYRADDRYDRIRQAIPEGIDVWWDTSGHLDLEACLPLMRRGGRVLVMAGLGATLALPVGSMYTNDVSLRGFAVSNATAGDLSKAAVAINHLLTAGSLKARIGATYHLADAAKAHEAMESGPVRGRILVVP
ncbi:MAG TPA: NADPH:quinone reductase [Aldersonia sp.]